MQKKWIALSASLFTVLSFKLAYAASSIVVPMYLVSEDGKGQAIGSVTLETAKCGVMITPNLHDLPAGVHGFHIHEKPDCGDKGMAAGGHLDPAHTEKHEGPYAPGHLGDLPILVVDKGGEATLPSLAPKFKLSQFKGHSLMIHEGGDNYSDHPEKLGGGGARIACGVIK